MDQNRRLELQAMLEELLGSSNVYFQPPATVKMKYPCIVYEHNPTRKLRADNGTHVLFHPYLVTVIYRDPDSDLPDKLAVLPYCEHNRHFTSDNLYHDVFVLYY